MKHLSLSPVTLVWIGLAACHVPDAPSRPHLTTSLPTAAGAAPVHRATPIDCPLRKAGVDPGSLRPFAEVEKYIAFLERPERATWQKPRAVIEALHLKGTETVADVGAGSGYFSFPLAAALPHGRVRAIDIEPEMIRHIHHRAGREGVRNLEAMLATADDPKVGADTDLVFMCDVLHHVRTRGAWLQKLHDELRPGATLVLIEFKEGKLPAGPPASVKIPRDELVAIAERAGFRLTKERSDLLPYQYFLVFARG